MLSTFDIKNRYNNFIGEMTLFSYLGAISQSKIDCILLSIENSLNSDSFSGLIKKKIYNILVEGLQNIFLYTKKIKCTEAIDQAFVLVNQTAHGYKVIIGNYMYKKDAMGVKSRIEIVNYLERDELKDLYRSVLDIGADSQGGGAGLGIIDMAKRSSKKLVPTFCTVDNDFVFFTLEIEIQ